MTKYRELPIVGLYIKQIVLPDFELVFEDGSFLTLESQFSFTQYNQSEILKTYARESVVKLWDLIGASVKNTICDSNGNLYISFDNEIEIRITRENYTNWKYVNPKKDISIDF